MRRPAHSSTALAPDASGSQTAVHWTLPVAAILLLGCGDAPQALRLEPPGPRPPTDVGPSATLENRNNSGGLGHFLQISTLPLAIEREPLDAQGQATEPQPTAGIARAASGDAEDPCSDQESIPAEEEEESPAQ